MGKRLGLAMLVAAAASGAGAGGTANAAFPGANGKLAFVKAGDIWVANADGSNATQLTTAPGLDRSPRWSPDGAKIAFASGRDGDFEIFVMNADGSDQRQVTFNTGAQDRIPAWSADATQILYDKNFSEIYAINADGSGGERKLADGVVPGTSAHDDKVVFGHDGLVTMHLDGTARRQITNDPADFSANWSPQGNDFVFTRSTETDRDVYLAHANGTGLTRLTNTPDRFEFAPVWSPDNTKIAFVGCANGDCEIFVTNSDGSSETQVTTFGVSGGEGAVDWQPLAAATLREPVGQRINVFLGSPTTFPAGAPFHIRHGWGLGPEQAGIFSFRLDVDGVPRDADFVLRDTDPPSVTVYPYPLLNRSWVHNFRDGMTGTHTFTGHWITPCGVAVEFFGYPGPCRTPNEPVDAFARSLTVTFTP